ncbi:MAG: galactokinase [Spirochaetaceae bacterium]|jgi:galactokinase|nr:galactokinase [Spirochaetaceae bacterium]
MVDLIPAHYEEYGKDGVNKDEMVCAEAPGRLFYMGEHCRAAKSLVLTSGIDRVVRIAFSPRRDAALRFYTADTSERKRTTTANLRYRKEDRWANHVKIAFCLFAELGCEVGGFNVTLTTDIPRHTGLGYYIAVELASAVAMRKFFGVSISDKELVHRLHALHLNFYENDDKLVDMLTIMYAKPETYLVINSVSGAVKKIKSPFSGYSTLLLDSKVPWFGIEGELKARQKLLVRSIEALASRKPEFDFNAYPTDEITAIIGSFDEELRRCCMHIVSEIVRVKKTARALKEGDTAMLSKIFFKSHESLRDFYEISCPELDWLVKRAQETPGSMAARMTGKGFGGCTYAVLKPETVDEYIFRMDDYERIFGFRPLIYKIKPAMGARVINL